MSQVAGLVVAVAGLIVTSSCCCKPKLAGDVVSGAPKGAALVRVQVTLVESAGSCSVRVDPDRVIVFPGSAIRWRVVNGCGALTPNYIEFTRPTPRPGSESAEAWSYQSCTPRIEPVYEGSDIRNVLLCEVADSARPGLYKYGLQGGVRLDPDIEVRKGGGR